VAGVHYLRQIGQSDELKAAISAAGSMVVVGAGWIGLEITAAARAAGVAVTVVEPAELPLLRVLGPEVAQVFADLHRQHEVDLRFGASPADIVVADGRATGVRLSDGTFFAADAVVIGIGAIPNTELAVAAGLDVDNGVLVDAGLASSDPDIFAAGDIANAEHPLLRRRIRVEHWANAQKQPAIAAASMLGQAATYAELPYFYTDQYDLGMEYLGYVEPGAYDQVVFRGDLESREFIAFWVADSRVLAGMNVNVWDVQDDIGRLITAGCEGRPVDLAKLADLSVPLADL
jgi:3-phenylpropionate/trans-cinnamate dioxygenase ferredoxin reductase subunit